MAKFQSTKTYGNDLGLSCCFRQWRASHSHCSTLHGYSIGVKFVWESETLDEKNWCFDFGGMKPIKSWLDYMFDHTVVVAEDDPALDFFKQMAAYSTQEEWNGNTDHIGYQEPKPYSLGRLCDLRVVPGVGCEMFAKLIYDQAAGMLVKMKTGELARYPVSKDVRLASVEVFEHGANSAIYFGSQDLDKPLEAKPNLEMLAQLVAQVKSQDMTNLGNLEPFVDQLFDLHKVDPVKDQQNSQHAKLV
jgi:6-pyruvoyltetrahydropterin/6-carboxytetrahydropterin synthase